MGRRRATHVLDPLLFGEIKGPCVAPVFWDSEVAPDGDGDGDDCIEDEWPLPAY